MGLGAQNTSNEKDDRYIVNGSHTNVVLQDMVHKYIEKFVLCPNCGLPETTLKVSLKKETIHHVCAACGAKELADVSHKLCTYILAQEKKKKMEEKKMGKDSKKDKERIKEKKSASSDEDSAEKEKKKKKEKKEKKSKKKKEVDVVEEIAAEVDNLSVDDATLLS